MLSNAMQTIIKRQAQINLGDTGVYNPVEYLEEIVRLVLSTKTAEQAAEADQALERLEEQ